MTGSTGIPKTQHLAIGPNGLNLLGFLTAIGATALLERLLPDYSVRLSWELPRSGPGAGAYRPVLCIEPPVCEDEIVRKLYEGVTDPSAQEVFNGLHDNLKIPPSVFRDRARQFRTRRREADLLTALVAETSSNSKLRSRRARPAARPRALVAETGSNSELTPTPLRALTGGSGQHFLPTLRELSRNEQLTTEHIRRALFGPWTYQDIRCTFRWDPVDYRLHAYRALGPSDDRIHPIRTEWGANRLAFEGLVVFPMAWAKETVGIRSHRSQSGTEAHVDFEVRWPLWAPALSLDTIRSLLAHPWLFDVNRFRELEALGVMVIARSWRFMTQKGQVSFSAASPIWVAIQ